MKPRSSLREHFGGRIYKIVGSVTDGAKKIWHSQTMQVSKIHIQRAAIAIGIGVTVAAGTAMYWSLNPRNGCVRTLSTGGKSADGQEVVYVWGCLHPQRFRQWSIMAFVTDEGAAFAEVPHSSRSF